MGPIYIHNLGHFPTLLFHDDFHLIKHHSVFCAEIEHTLHYILTQPPSTISTLIAPERYWQTEGLKMSSEFSIGAMTPDTNTVEEDNTTIGIERKLSKSSITRGDDQSIPSPPLSPYLSASSSADTSTARHFSELKSIGRPSGGSIETIVVLSKTPEFPVTNFEKSPLVLNAWSGIGPNYKRAQLDFLKQYFSRHVQSKGISKYSPPRKYLPRRVTTKPVNYFNDVLSDSEYSSSQVRTRRVMKENSTALEDISKASTPSPAKKRKPAASPAVHVNVDWESVPDFSPSHSTLPSHNRSMRVEWKGQPMDLKSDPLVHLLHPAEVTLASILRLPCNLFLDSKRRLFQEKVARMRRGLPFRRTDAQKSCRIDVNKASRLFAAFEKCGWLEDSLFEKYM